MVRLGAIWCETDAEAANDLMSGQYKDPLRVVAFNTVERWSEDVSEYIAREIRRRFDLQLFGIGPTANSDFVDGQGSLADSDTERLVEHGPIRETISMSTSHPVDRQTSRTKPNFRAAAIHRLSYKDLAHHDSQIEAEGRASNIVCT
ncbi:hypothetical protein JQ597_32660 [Bradyrhizobium sp. AUGA SZCCT0177]|uniref:hypothetical protein n=1 Tax=Bradyrhizobium sp. AUGA SZCCT0177 TaxID=2807665 RepID=UPI001BA6E9B5|nr:hypothetical protein [Bradyrhizobium sp. AUGA SZCCT0177]MBR1286818.1 hypothetical protein [Bradyrhizobium sp. AUGA SZCCT0177]